MILTGEPINAKEAEADGLVAKVFPVDKLVEEAINSGKLKISTRTEYVILLSHS